MGTRRHASTVRAGPHARKRHLTGIGRNTHNQWHYAFTNTFSEEESRALYERYHLPASRDVLWGSVVANVKPGHQDTCVDYKNDERAPLLFIAGLAEVAVTTGLLTPKPPR